MQLIETSALGVRAATWQLTSTQYRASILLMPMIHVAPMAFYQAMLEQMKTCDIILYEGVKSKSAGIITSAYGQLAKNKRLNFVEQRDMDLSPVKDRMIHADIPAATFDTAWHNLPVYRYFILLASPIVGLYWRLFGTPQMLARHLGLSTLDTRLDVLTEGLEELDDLILRQRDQIINSQIDMHLRDRGEEDIRIGLVYGAMHMKAIAPYLLHQHGFVSRDGNWIDVFQM